MKWKGNPGNEWVHAFPNKPKTLSSQTNQIETHTHSVLLDITSGYTSIHLQTHPTLPPYSSWLRIPHPAQSHTLLSPPPSSLPAHHPFQSPHSHSKSRAIRIERDQPLDPQYPVFESSTITECRGSNGFNSGRFPSSAHICLHRSTCDPNDDCSFSLCMCEATGRFQGSRVLTSQLGR